MLSCCCLHLDGERDKEESSEKFSVRDSQRFNTPEMNVRIINSNTSES